MRLHFFKFITLILFNILYHCHCSRCIPKISYAVRCNRCWCVNDGIPLCTKMKCSDIPSNFWKVTKLKKRSPNPKIIEKLKSIWIDGDELTEKEAEDETAGQKVHPRNNFKKVRSIAAAFASLLEFFTRMKK
ncbi:hypothetical protein ILUMI_11578 [Ignelater luminosus]|uniref:Pacifastin domain-containing protein n=1 Tax=Ignelater luminosus TaxID=2038154 RepID=A0A8K0GAD8_IGNLU|nr:hypothetical protein ILUMI_11578 [Ignelater luminosus]